MPPSGGLRARGVWVSVGRAWHIYSPSARWVDKLVRMLADLIGPLVGSKAWLEGMLGYFTKRGQCRSIISTFHHAHLVFVSVWALPSPPRPSPPRPAPPRPAPPRPATRHSRREAC